MLMAGSISTMMNLRPSEIVYCTLAATLPDRLESIWGIRIIPHRTLTHEVLLWLAPLLLLRFFPQIIPERIAESIAMPAEKYLAFRMWVLFLPGLLHLAGDFLTPRGIRIAGFKAGLGLFSTGHMMEYVFIGLLILVTVLYKTR